MVMVRVKLRVKAVIDTEITMQIRAALFNPPELLYHAMLSYTTTQHIFFAIVYSNILYYKLLYYTALCCHIQNCNIFLLLCSISLIKLLFKNLSGDLFIHIPVYCYSSHQLHYVMLYHTILCSATTTV
jgi:hypothetical protein